METIDNEINESRRLEAIQDMNYFISLMTPEIFQDQIKVQYKGYSGEKSLSTNIKTMSVCLSTDEMFFYTPEGLFVCRQIFHPRKFCFWDYERAKEYLNECSIEYLLERFNDNIKDNKFCFRKRCTSFQHIICFKQSINPLLIFIISAFDFSIVKTNVINKDGHPFFTLYKCRKLFVTRICLFHERSRHTSNAPRLITKRIIAVIRNCYAFNNIHLINFANLSLF